MQPLLIVVDHPSLYTIFKGHCCLVRTVFNTYGVTANITIQIKFHPSESSRGSISNYATIGPAKSVV